jgi:hypothetical protein
MYNGEVLITPEIAAEWLKCNPNNRHVRGNDVMRYSRDMVSGKWQLNGETIKFDTNGDLLDGQHRLRACVVAGVPFKSIVVRGLPPEARKTVDTGVKRQFSDQLRMGGEVNGHILAALLRRIVLWENRDYLGKGRSSKSTEQELEAVLERVGDDARDSANLGARLNKICGIHPSVLAFSHWLFTQIDAEEADWFLERLADGVNLPAQHPVLTLRERLAKDRQSNLSADATYTIALIIISWNCFRARRPLKSLKIPVGGLTRDNYPLPR